MSDRGGVRVALRGAVSALALGCLCCFLCTLALGPATRVIELLALHLFTAPLSRAAASILMLGILQACVSALALSLLGLLFEIAPAVALAAGAFAALFPFAVLLVVQGPAAFSAPWLTAAHALTLALGGAAGYFSARRVRRFLESRARSREPGAVHREE